MELNRQNQLVISETDIIHSERYSCPSCFSETYFPSIALGFDKSSIADQCYILDTEEFKKEK